MPPSTLSGSPKSMTHGSMPALVQNPDGALVAGDVPHVGRHHHRMHHQHRRPRWFRAGPGVGREVPAQPVHRHAFHDLERRRHGAGLQAAVSQHFQAVLRGGHQPAHGPRLLPKGPPPAVPLYVTPIPRLPRSSWHRAGADLSSAADGELDQRRTRDGRLRHPHAAGRRQPRRRRRRRDRRRRAQRRRQVHAAAGADRNPRARLGPGHPHLGLVGGLSAPNRRLRRRLDRPRGHRRRQARPHLGRRTRHPRRRRASAGRGGPRQRRRRPQRR